MVKNVEEVEFVCVQNQENVPQAINRLLGVEEPLPPEPQPEQEAKAPSNCQVDPVATPIDENDKSIGIRES